jgi:hypothetical protein
MLITAVDAAGRWRGEAPRLDGDPEWNASTVSIFPRGR